MTNLTIPATQARNNFFELLEKLDNPALRITITYKGRPKAVLVNAEEFDSAQETLEILSDKNLMRDIGKAEKEFEKGDYHTFEEVFGCTPAEILADKGKAKYKAKKSEKISPRHSQKSK